MPRESRSLSVKSLPAFLLLGFCLVATACNGQLAFDSPPSPGSSGSAGSSGGGGSAGASGNGGNGGNAGSAGSAGANAGAGNAAGGSSHDPLACNSDRDCGLATLHCQPTSHQCVECLYDQQCPPERPACSPGTKRCQECDGLTPCPNGQFCDLQTDKCLTRCHADSNCNPALNEHCNSEGLCETCDGNEECNFKLGGVICQRSTGACVQCLQGDDECGGPVPHCLLPEARCVGCVDSSDCTSTAPYCDPVLHQCAAATG